MPGTLRTPLIAGNWKQNTTAAQALHLVQKLAWTLRDAGFDATGTEVAVMPPFPWLRSVATLLERDAVPVALGAQDVSVFDGGAHTGEVSAAMLADAGCRYVLVGHSERRSDRGDRSGDTDQVVAVKLRRALAAGLTPVLCIGETTEVRDQGQAVEHNAAQVRAALAAVDGRDEVAADRLVVAYEPLWAIGSGASATPQDAQQMCAAVREELAGRSGRAAADATRILYGGSVTTSTVVGLLEPPDVDGVLVGGASLDPTQFAGICRFRDLPRI